MESERLPHEAEISWFVRCHASALGERGTSGQMIDLLKFGIPTGGGLPRDNHTDRGLDDVARARRCFDVFRAISAHARVILVARYDSRHWMPGIASQLGDYAGVVAAIEWSKQSEAGGSREDFELGLSRTCQLLTKSAMQRRAAWLKRAERECANAHGEWADARRLVAHMWAKGE